MDRLLRFCSRHQDRDWCLDFVEAERRAKRDKYRAQPYDEIELKYAEALAPLGRPGTTQPGTISADEEGSLPRRVSSGIRRCRSPQSPRICADPPPTPHALYLEPKFQVRKCSTEALLWSLICCILFDVVVWFLQVWCATHRGIRTFKHPQSTFSQQDLRGILRFLFRAIQTWILELMYLQL